MPERRRYCSFEGSLNIELADEEQRTIPVTVSTGDSIQRQDYDGDYILEMIHTEDSIDLSRAPLPLQEEHTNSINLGLVDELRLEQNDLVGQIRMGQSSRASDLWPDIKNGIIRNVSIGATYSVSDVDETMENGVRKRTVKRWQPYHVALVGAGANPRAQIHHGIEGESNMPSNVNQSQQTPSAELSQEELQRIAENAVTQERNRQTEIRRSVRVAQLGEEFADELIQLGISAGEAQSRIINRWAEAGGPPTNNQTHITLQADAADKARKGVTEWLEFKCGMKGAQCAPDNNFRGFSLREIVREMLHVRGINTAGASVNRMLELGYHGQSDFKAVVENIATKALMAGFEGAEETWQSWCETGSLPDFKPASRVEMGMFRSLDEVPRGAEITHTTTADRRELIALSSYSNLFSLDFQSIQDDDVNAFSRIPQGMGSAAAHTIGDLVYLHALTGSDPMSDGAPLFDASHNNMQPGSGITTDSVDEMGTAMALQTATGADDRILRLSLNSLIVPRTLRGTARTVADSQFKVGAGGDTDNTTINHVNGTFNVVAEPRLDQLSTTAWYGVAANRTIEVAFLNGQQTPTLESWEGMTVLGMTWRVVLHVGAKALDWRTFQYNPGV